VAGGLHVLLSIPHLGGPFIFGILGNLTNGHLQSLPTGRRSSETEGTSMSLTLATI
jgi:hypothetical protein